MSSCRKIDNSAWNRIDKVTTAEGVITSWTFANDSENPGQYITMSKGPVTTVYSLNAWGQILSENISESGVTFTRTTTLDGSSGLPKSVRIGSQTVFDSSRGSKGELSSIITPAGSITPNFDPDGKADDFEGRACKNK